MYKKLLLTTLLTFAVTDTQATRPYNSLCKNGLKAAIFCTSKSSTTEKIKAILKNNCEINTHDKCRHAVISSPPSPLTGTPFCYYACISSSKK